MSRTTEQPVHRGKSAPTRIAPDNERIVRERLRTIEHDAKTATDWDKSAFLRRLPRRP